MYSYDYWYIIYLPMDKIWGQNRSNVILACYKRQLKGKSSMSNAWQIYGVIMVWILIILCKKNNYKIYKWDL